jgi:hypothetical protein
MDIDFIEIGTSNFDTLIEKVPDDIASDAIIGYSIDILQTYLDDLPNKKNVVKCCVGITGPCPKNAEISVYYIPKEIIKEKNLSDWYRGCNTIGKYHPVHIQNNMLNYVAIDTVNVITLKDFYLKHKIRKCKYLKIDTEGHDTIILKEFINYLKEVGSDYYPSKIKFESNELTDGAFVDEIIDLYTDIGYTVKSRGYDTIIEFS